jgi:hypothetical protein
VHYVTHQPNKAHEHFYGLREAKGDLVGFALFDRLDQALQKHAALKEHMWKRREIENYLAIPEVLLKYSESAAEDSGPLFEPAERKKRRDAMQECIDDLAPRAALRDLSDRWWVDTKMSDDFLDRVFESFFKKLSLPNLIRKTDYHVLTDFITREQIDAEVAMVLDSIMEIVGKAVRPPED